MEDYQIDYMDLLNENELLIRAMQTYIRKITALEKEVFSLETQVQVGKQTE